MSIVIHSLRPLRHMITGLAVICGTFMASTTVIAAEPAPASAGPFIDYQLASPKPNLAKIKEHKIEKPSLTFGIIKLTDCCPLVVALLKRVSASKSKFKRTGKLCKSAW